MAKPDSSLPTWAPRVRKGRIRRLYETDARGVYDEELVDEVGCALLAATHGRANRTTCQPARRSEPPG